MKTRVWHLYSTCHPIPHSNHSFQKDHTSGTYRESQNVPIASNCLGDTCNVRISRTMTTNRFDKSDMTIMCHTHISISQSTVGKLSPSAFSLETAFSTCAFILSLSFSIPIVIDRSHEYMHMISSYLQQDLMLNETLNKRFILLSTSVKQS